MFNAKRNEKGEMMWGRQEVVLFVHTVCQGSCLTFVRDSCLQLDILVL